MIGGGIQEYTEAERVRHLRALEKEVQDTSYWGIDCEFSMSLRA